MQKEWLQDQTQSREAAFRSHPRSLRAGLVMGETMGPGTVEPITFSGSPRDLSGLGELDTPWKGEHAATRWLARQSHLLAVVAAVGLLPRRGLAAFIELPFHRLGITGLEGDVDLLIVERDGLDLDLRWMAACEVKRLKVGDEANARGETGTEQAKKLLRLGFEASSLAHLLVQRPVKVSADLATLQAQTPAEAMERVLGRPQIQELLDTRLGYLQFGLGHLPGKRIGEAYSWAAHPVPPVVEGSLNSEARRSRRAIRDELPKLLRDACSRAEGTTLDLNHDLLVIEHDPHGPLRAWSGHLQSVSS